jgi:predicted metal-dependent phosphotriesterase family hydrolase
LVLSSDFIGDEQLAGLRERPTDTPQLRSVNGRPPGWARTVTVFVPMMRKAGVDEPTIRRILVDNPRRLMACRPKFPRTA